MTTAATSQGSTESDGGARRVAVTGASGFIGSALVRLLESRGWEVHRLVRRAPRANEIGWHPERDWIDGAALEGMDAIVHLAGESLTGVWTPGRKRRILESRARGTRLLASALAGLHRPPRVLVSASAVGYYGNAGDRVLTESAPPGDDFLAQVCVAWEEATEPAAAAGIRVVRTRFGLVLDRQGGALPLMLLPFRFGLGARLGGGKQWMSWISLPDCVRVIEFALTTESLVGPVNAVSPEPVRNEEFTRIVAAALHRPAFLSLPAFILRAVTGGMADSLMLVSQRVVPAVLLDHGFEFVRPRLEHVLRPGVD